MAAPVEAGVYAEDRKRFFASPGPSKVFRPALGGYSRRDGQAEGGIVAPFNNPTIAKMIA
jgi:acetyl/propionyl-CoA carboxylase alpha subunit